MRQTTNSSKKDSEVYDEEKNDKTHTDSPPTLVEGFKDECQNRKYDCFSYEENV